MATNLSIDPDLLERALELSGERTKKAAVNKALREFIARREKKYILQLFGKLDWDKKYDYKKNRYQRPTKTFPKSQKFLRSKSGPDQFQPVCNREIVRDDNLQEIDTNTDLFRLLGIN